MPALAAARTANDRPGATQATQYQVVFDPAWVSTRPPAHGRAVTSHPPAYVPPAAGVVSAVSVGGSTSGTAGSAGGRQNWATNRPQSAIVQWTSPAGAITGGLSVWVGVRRPSTRWWPQG